MASPGGGDDGGGKKTPHWALQYTRKRGPGWFGLRRATHTDIRLSLQSLRALRNGIVALGVLALIANSQWANQWQHTVDTVDKKIPDWNSKAKDPDKK
jgi:hypothetical protein